MNRIKDFFYDKNDIILTLIILAVAAGVIIWRLDAIMNYPAALAKETHTDVTTQEEVPDDNDDAEDESETAEPDSDSPWKGDVLASDVTVTVSSGSASAAVDSLVHAGLFRSYEDFSSVCSSIGHNPESIIARNYTFEAGSTQEDIAREVTN